MRALIIYIFFVSIIFGEGIRLTNGEFQPYTSEDIKNYGIVSQIVKEAFSLEGIEVEYFFYPWNRALILASENVYDGSIGWSKTKEREEKFLYSENPVFKGKAVFFYMDTLNFEWETFEDLKRYKIGMTRGYSLGEFFSEAERLAKVDRDAFFDIEYANEDIQNLKKLVSGRVDIFPLDLYVGKYFIAKYFPKCADKIKFSEKALYEGNQYLILYKSEKNKKIMKKFDRGLKDLIESGRYDEIEKSYLDSLQKRI